MKPYFKVFLFFLSIVCCSIIFSCSKSVTMSAELPAQVGVGGNLKVLALVNRTQPSDKKLTTLEGIISGEGFFQDQRGGYKILEGINKGLIRSNRFQVKPTGIYLKGSSGVGFSVAPPMAWSEVEQICKTHQADGLCVLEGYDSNSQILPSTKMVTKVVNNVNVQVPTFIVALQVTIKAAIRIYNLKDKTIKDEFIQDRVFNWSSSGNTALEAMNTIIDKSQATDRASTNFGIDYSQRLIPTFTTVTRVYYKKGGDGRLKTAWRRSQVKDWEGAGVLFEEIIKNSNSVKAKGRATHNLAVIREIYNRLEEAKSLAAKAYTDYRVKASRSYVDELLYRIENEKIIENQMK